KIARALRAAEYQYFYQVAVERRPIRPLGGIDYLIAHGIAGEPHLLRAVPFKMLYAFERGRDGIDAPRQQLVRAAQDCVLLVHQGRNAAQFRRDQRWKYRIAAEADDH